MTSDRDETAPGPPAAPGQAKGKKNAAALSAALRANLQRRKARERALREAGAARESDGGDEANGEAARGVKSGG